MPFGAEGNSTQVISTLRVWRGWMAEVRVLRGKSEHSTASPVPNPQGEVGKAGP